MAAPPSGMPSRMQALRRVVEQPDEDRPRLPRRRQLGDAGERRAEQPFDEEHERQRPHRGAPREAADGDEHGDVGDAADRGGHERRPRARRAAGDERRERRGRGDRHQRDRRAAEPAPEHDLPRRRRRQPREVERAGADLGAEHGVADDQRGDRHDEAEDALGGDVGEGVVGRVVDGAGEQPEQQRADARQQDRRPALRREARLPACRRGSPRSRGRGRHVRRDRGRRCSSDQLPEQALQRVVERTDLEQADRRALASRGSATASSRACSVCTISSSRLASNVTPATDSSPTSAAASRRLSSAAHQHVARRVVHRVADGAVAAGRGEPAVHQHDHPLGQPLDLVEHVRADDHRAALRAELLEQRDEVQRAAPGRRRSAVRRARARRGSVTSAAAILVRWRMPLLNVSTWRSADVEQLDGAQRAVGRVAVGDAVEVGDVAHELAGGEPAGHRLVLGHQRHHAVHGAVAARVAAR